MRLTALFLAPFLACAGCAGQERLTSKAIDCPIRELTIVSSKFKRQGVETAWCARCRDKLYQCATNAERTRVECFEAKEGGACF